MRLGVAMYYYEIMRYYHWALVVCKSDGWHEGPFDVYDLKRPERGVGYERHHVIVNPGKSEKFTGVVELLFVPNEEGGGRVANMIMHECERHPADGPLNPLVNGPLGWTCAAWILDILYSLDEMGIWEPSKGTTIDQIYGEIIKAADRCRSVLGTVHPYPVGRPSSQA